MHNLINLFMIIIHHSQVDCGGDDSQGGAQLPAGDERDRWSQPPRHLSTEANVDAFGF